MLKIFFIDADKLTNIMTVVNSIPLYDNSDGHLAPRGLYLSRIPSFHYNWIFASEVCMLNLL